MPRRRFYFYLISFTYNIQHERTLNVDGDSGNKVAADPSY